MSDEHHAGQRPRSLRISRVVRNRSKAGLRVMYDIDPPGTPADAKRSRQGIPEDVVLVRWRRRSRSGRQHSGTRLSPTIWRALPAALGADVAQWRTMNAAQLETALQDARESLRTAGREGAPLVLPNAMALHALITLLPTGVLEALVTRHADAARHAEPGVPDLFLYAMRDDGRFDSPRFVEVKKPEERLYPHQRAEIAFMAGLGLDVRVMRLLEADAPRPRRGSAHAARR